MKHLGYTLLFACFATCLGCHNNGIDPRVLTLPSLKLLPLDSSRTIDTKDIAGGEATVLMYFNPDCKFSRQQTENILANYSSLQHIRFYLCSPYPLTKLNDFSKHYQLSRFNNIVVGRDYEMFFDKQLKINSFPWLFIYAPNKQLKRIITGSVDAKTIIHMVNG